MRAGSSMSSRRCDGAAVLFHDCSDATVRARLLAVPPSNCETRRASRSISTANCSMSSAAAMPTRIAPASGSLWISGIAASLVSPSRICATHPSQLGCSVAARRASQDFDRSVRVRGIASHERRRLIGQLRRDQRLIHRSNMPSRAQSASAGAPFERIGGLQPPMIGFVGAPSCAERHNSTSQQTACWTGDIPVFA